MRSSTCMLMILTLASGLVSASSMSENGSTNNFGVGGLVNLGNTCYLNAQLQCIYHIPKARDLIIHSQQQKSQKRTQTQEMLGLAHVFSNMQQNNSPSSSTSTSTPTTTRVLCQVLGINPYEQQDSQEFWKLLLPELKSTPLVDLYQGAYEDYVAALDGSGRERRREEPFLDLSLDISSGSVLKSMEDTFGKPELLSEEEGNGWRPEKGADKVDALKGSLLRVPGLPSILQLHLKRFQYDWQTDTMSKIKHRFKFPKALDLSTICTDIPKDQDPLTVIYDLHSLVIHVGEYGSGHYYAYVRPDVRTNVWFRLDDSEVTKVKFREVCADAFGGQSSQNRESSNNNKKKGIWARFLAFFSGDGNAYGYGGRTSCAYMVQYVRRSDIPMLYLEESKDK
eukprot:CAMPEP_0198287676 /NCGR_PEP_ID=MMETSP1449-20131203/6399_1 /TAXON_ID=420275 /ORGANISM="Attheya septentrionalis, Strain CCMP2084" /LENGTH=394 /DNA_ID=CAMNT_0043985651 /DNA_START=252 /DNA_END=1436 /DNA_ORIENTATION=+